MPKKVNIELIQGKDTGAPVTDKLWQAYPKINRSIKNLKEMADDHDQRIETAEGIVTSHGGRLDDQDALIVALQTGDSGPAANAARYNSITGITHDSLKDRLDIEYQAVEQQLANLSKKELLIDVTAPPKGTGLLPLTLSNPAQDATRLQAIFDYIKANEYSVKPDNKQSTGYTYTIRFPKGIITLGAKVVLKGQYLNLIGDGTVIKTTHSDNAFESTGTDARKLNMQGFVFIDVKTALEQINSNIDTCAVNIEKCWFYTTSGVAVKIQNQSCMVLFRQCQWYHCRFIYEAVDPDQTIFDNCWFSELPREANGEVSITLRGTYAKFRECFFIPSGYDRDAVTTNEPNLTDIAWIASYGSVEVDGCRISSEPNSKTLINSYAPAVNNPYAATMVKVTNNHRLSCAYGECIVRLFDVPNQINISNNGIVRNNDVPIKYGTGFDVNAWLAANSTIFPDNTKIEIVLNDNVGQNTNNWSCPSELKKFLRFNHVASGMIKKDKDITSTRSGTITNAVPYFDITSNLKTSGTTFAEKSFLVKMVTRPSDGQQTYRSVFIGLLTFTIGMYNSVLSAKANLTPLISTQGGSVTNQGSPVTVTATFLDTGTDTTPIYQGSTVNYGVRITWTSMMDDVDGSRSQYMVKELMDGAFLF